MTTACALQATSQKTRSLQTRKQICSPSWRNATTQQRKAIDSLGWGLAASDHQRNLPRSAFRSHSSSNSNQAWALPPTKEAIHTCCLHWKKPAFRLGNKNHQHQHKTLRLLWKEPAFRLGNNQQPQHQTLLIHGSSQQHRHQKQPEQQQRKQK